MKANEFFEVESPPRARCPRPLHLAMWALALSIPMIYWSSGHSYPISGNYKGKLPEAGIKMRMHLEQIGGTVTGRGSLRIGREPTRKFDIQGSLSGQKLRLKSEVANDVITFDGHVAPRSGKLTLTGMARFRNDPKVGYFAVRQSRFEFTKNR